jgi:hypothetical protein
VKPESLAASPATSHSDFRVGPGRLLVRWVGVLLWRCADPSTLPVRPDGPAVSRREAGRLLSAVITLSWVATLLVGGAGFAAWQHFRTIQAEFLRNPPGLSLEATAERMDRGAGGPWKLLHPVASQQVTILARSVREGARALQDAARAYETAGTALRGLGPVARRSRGRALVEPLRISLDAVRTPWHRETIAYREMHEALAPYLGDAATGDDRLGGRITALTPGHALQLQALAADGHPLEKGTLPLQPGTSFDLPLVRDGWLLLTDLVPKERGVFEIRESTRVPLLEWSEEPIRFPRGGAFVQVSFTGRTARAAPPLVELSPGARTELGWPGAGER